MNKKLIISNIKLDIDEPFQNIFRKISKEGIKCEDSNISILKKSLDARDKSDIKYVYNLLIEGDYKVSGRLSNKISDKEITKYVLPSGGAQVASGRHVVVGMGPAGLFAGLILARCGYKPLIIERGEKVEERTNSVRKFWNDNTLNTESNVCFGEGGAGTFSDGKLNTGIKDNLGRKSFVLETFASAGADESIKYWYKPHVGSDVLAKVVANIREEIIQLGGEILFNTKLVDIKESNNLVLSVESYGNIKNIHAETLILATGHSARDTYQIAQNAHMEMRCKPFAVGVRIEHPQDMINRSQYGDIHKNDLPVADYKCACKTPDGRGVYSFCMCPGGKVVNSSSEVDGLLVNGMSYSARDGRNANSAIIVTVDNTDFGDGVFDGLNYQKSLEKLAFSEGRGVVPVQRFDDYKKGNVSNSLGEISPDICGEYQFGNLRNIFPDEINNSISCGITNFAKNIEGFDRDDAILSGVESRTSSPIKMYRDNNFESNIKGIFPCGEGAGYAGGIMSAAIDGIKVAEEIVRRYKA